MAAACRGSAPPPCNQPPHPTPHTPFGSAARWRQTWAGWAGSPCPCPSWWSASLGASPRLGAARAGRAGGGRGEGDGGRGQLRGATGKPRRLMHTEGQGFGAAVGDRRKDSAALLALTDTPTGFWMPAALQGPLRFMVKVGYFTTLFSTTAAHCTTPDTCTSPLRVTHGEQRATHLHGEGGLLHHLVLDHGVGGVRHLGPRHRVAHHHYARRL